MFESLRGPFAATLGIVVAFVLASTCKTSKPEHATASGPAWANDPAIERRVDTLLAQMTLREKIGQLNQL